MAAIAADPDTFELDAEWFATAKSFREVYPDGIDRPPRPPAELWPERFAAKPENEAWDEAKRRHPRKPGGSLAKHARKTSTSPQYETLSGPPPCIMQAPGTANCAGWPSDT